MNIDMINNQSANRMMDVDKSQYGAHLPQGSRMNTQQMGYSLDITGKVTENAAYGKGELKSAQDIALEAGMTDVSLERNYKAVMSNSMSDEDFAKLCEDGVNPTNTTVEESTTNLDKIKLTMAEAGITIAGYNDDLTREDIQAIVGSDAVASSIASTVAGNAEAIVADAEIEDALTAMDLPATRENLDGMKEAYSIASSLSPLSDESIKYMLTNDMEPTIENLYMAEHSSGEESGFKGTGPIYSGLATYASASSTEAAWDKLKDQALAVVDKANIPDTEKGLEDAKWLVENQIPLTAENLEEYEKLTDITLPAEPETVIKAMAVAIEEGKEPKQADLTVTESIYEKAVKLVSDFANMSDGGDITRRRQLEEVRLAMSAEANLTLLRKGIQIETEPLVELVDKLKEAEREFYRPVLEGPNVKSDREEATDKSELSLDEKINIFKEARSIVEELPTIPVKTVADIVFNRSENREASEITNVSDIADLSDNQDRLADDFTLRGIGQLSREAKAGYEKAFESYEALMTAPRADMGDSIRKAFSNVDDILEDIGMDLNEANRKAVRTLGYAGMDINRDSIDTIRESTMTVQRVATLMTPAKTLQLIRDGFNPLNENMEDLAKKLSEETVEESSEKYSQFLWNLEKKGQITEDEKTAYIGMYRLLHQIEKQDGRVIGNVLNNGQELTMANMLSASRSNRHKNMDVIIDDDFGTLEELVSKEDSILDQIEKGFTQLMEQPLSKEYAKQRVNEVRRALKTEGEAEELLKKLDEPVTIENIYAAGDLLTLGGKAVKKLFNGEDRKENRPSAATVTGRKSDSDDSLSAEDADVLLDDFTDKESAEEVYEKYIEKAMEIAEKRIENADKYIDVREWAMVHKQLGFASSMSQKEAYDIPIRTENGYTAVHLTIQHGSEETGKVTASLESEEYGRVEAKFSLRQDGVDGFIVSDSRGGIANLKQKEEAIKDALLKDGIETSNLSFVYSRTSQKADYIPEESDVTNNQLYKLARAFILAIQS